jgi:hypothetical protein
MYPSDQNSGDCGGHDRTAGGHKAQRSEQVGERCDNWSEARRISIAA